MMAFHISERLIESCGTIDLIIGKHAKSFIWTGRVIGLILEMKINLYVPANQGLSSDPFSAMKICRFQIKAAHKRRCN
jgi:hypothetical protein